MPKRAKGKLELPIHVVVYEILTRLSAKTVSKFRCVCRTWNFLISQPRFQKEHREHAQRNPLLLVMHNEYDSCFVSFSTYSKHGESLLKRFSKIFPERQFSMPSNKVAFCPIQSCLGLVCIRNFDDGAITVLNPSTEEIITLPNGQEQEWDVWVGFGFAASTGEFKVVRFLDTYEDSLKCRCEVFTLGSSNSWRQARSNPPFFPDLQRHMPFLHGAVHFLPSLEYTDILDHHIAAFDVVSEEHREVTLPRNYSEERYLSDGCYLSDDRGSLCVIFSFFSSNKTLQLWTLKDYRSGNWVRGYNISLSTGCLFGNPVGISDDGNLLLTLVKRVPVVISDDGNLLLSLLKSALDHELCCYSTQEKRVVKTIVPNNLTNHYGVFYTESLWPLGGR